MSAQPTTPLPPVPAPNGDSKAFESACDAALGILRPMIANLHRDLGEATARRLTKAKQHLSAELGDAEIRLAQIRIARGKSIYAASTAEAWTIESQRGETLPTVESAQKAFDVAQERLKKARGADDWLMNRARICSNQATSGQRDADEAQRDLDLLEGRIKAVTYSNYTPREVTLGDELAILGR